MPKAKKPEVKEPKVEKKPKGLGSLGVKNIKIQSKGIRKLNGREYVDIQLINGETMLLTEKDFKKQHNK